LSARLDGEEQGLSEDLVDAHLLGCSGCQAWLDGARRVIRVVASMEQQAPDLTESTIRAVEADPWVAAQRARLRTAAETHSRRQILRVAVAAAAVVQLVLALPSLFGAVTGTAGAGLHATREMASFDVAVAVGFVLAAWRPQRAMAFVPVAFVLAGCLAGTSVVDIVHGVTGVGHEVVHLVAMVQAGLLWVLGRVDRAQPPASARSGAPGPSLVAAK
jgi:predicted anti-sigma-YlaC factor YlaD